MGRGAAPRSVQVLNKEPGIPPRACNHRVPKRVRMALWGLATVTAGPAIGFAWLASMARFAGSRGGGLWGAHRGVEWSRRAGARS